MLAAVAMTGAFLSAIPVSAQQTPAPMASAKSAPDLAPDLSMTPPKATTPQSAAPLTPLVIPPPPGGKLRVEMDARSEDLLGLVKSFLKGIGETGPPPAATPGRALLPPNPVADAIANGDLAAMLQDVNHVHVVVYEVAGSKSKLPGMTVNIFKPGVKKPLMVIPPVSVLPTFDSNSFYENAFAAEGAHRLLFTDADEYKLVMVGFPDRRGFAFAASGGGYVVVERSDGYPNLEVLTAFISHVTTAVVNSQMGKKAINSTLDNGKLTGPEVKPLARP